MPIGFYFSITKTPENISQKEEVTGSELQPKGIKLPTDNQVGFLNYPFHKDIKDLLWFADSPLKNLDVGKSIQHYSSGDFTCYFSDASLEEPSVIVTSHTIEFPKDIEQVEPTPYYPTYRELTPLQKGVYFTLLENPYESGFNIGYIFLLFYGLERHLFEGNLEDAVDVIFKLRKAHDNKSFQNYSANTLILTSIYKDKGEIALQLLNTEKHYDLHKLPISLYLICASSFNLHITAFDLMDIGDWFGFKNKNYIKKYPELFENTLSKMIAEEKGRTFLLISDYLTEDDSRKLPLHPMKVFANVSLRDVKVNIPFLTESTKLRTVFYELLSKCHENVKKYLAEQRKKQK